MSTGERIGGRGRGGQRRTTGTKLDVRTAKEKCLEFIEAGLTVESATEKVGRSVKTWEYWRRNDADFKAKADLAMSLRKVGDDSREGYRLKAMEMGFEAWRRKYLHTETFWHQRQWIDILEGRDPADLHPAQTYMAGSPGMVVINTPVFHAKSTTITIDYVTYRICIDPNVRIAIISKRDQKASEFLTAVKERLTQPRFAELVQDFAPEGGYKATAESWTAHRIYIGGDRDSADPDPTVQSLGLGSQIYGARLDLIILDDCITSENVNDWEKQLFWLNTQVLSRPSPEGTVLVVGTRLAPYDLYGQLMNPDNYGGEESPWTYLAQPAILEEGTDDQAARVLWPYATMPWAGGNSRFSTCKTCAFYRRRSGDQDKDCFNESIEINGVQMWPRWDLFHLEWGPKRRMSPREWALIYQQQALPEDAIFPEFAVKAAVNNRRRWGRDGGLESVPANAYWIGAMDPATSGNAFSLVYAIDRATLKRYVVDAVNMKAPTPARLKGVIKEWSELYPIKEWVVEKTGLLTMFTQDHELNMYLANRGIRFRKHFTGGNKWDADFGVASMAGLFGAYEKTTDGILKEIHPPLIDFPRIDTPGLKLLIDQLLKWGPELDPNKVPTDAVMALWFAEIGARDQVKNKTDQREHFGHSRWHSKRQLASRQVIDLTDYMNRTA